MFVDEANDVGNCYVLPTPTEHNNGLAVDFISAKIEFYVNIDKKY